MFESRLAHREKPRVAGWRLPAAIASAEPASAAPAAAAVQRAPASFGAEQRVERPRPRPAVGDGDRAHQQHLVPPVPTLTPPRQIAVRRAISIMLARRNPILGLAPMWATDAPCDDSGVARTVLIVDDHAEFRRNARALLEADGFEVVGEAADGESAIFEARRLQPQAA